MIKLKDVLKEGTGAAGAGDSDNGGQWGAPGKVRKLRGFELPRGWAQIDNGPKADNPFGKNTEYRKDTHDIEIPDNYYQPIESDDYVTSGVDEKGENFVQAKAKKSEYSAFGKSMIDELKLMKLKTMLKHILSEAKFDKVADKIWDKIISNKIHVTKSQLKDLSDDHARKGHYNKKELYKAVKRVAKQKNWFTKFIAKTVK